MTFGGTINKHSFTNETAFTEMLEQSTFQYIHSRSTGGLLFSITVPDGRSPYSRFRSNDFGSDVNHQIEFGAGNLKIIAQGIVRGIHQGA